MNAIELSEAKAKFSTICAEVAAKEESVLVTLRGKPLVRIEPVSPVKTRGKSVWELRAAFIKVHGPIEEDFDVPSRVKQAWRNPLDD